MNLSEEQSELLKLYTKLLSGQLRGAMVKSARDENEEYIYMTLSKVFELGFIEGVNITSQEIKDKKVRDEIIQGIVNDISKNTSEE